MRPWWWWRTSRANWPIRTGAKLPFLHRIYRAVREVTEPVVSGMVIIVIVFLPLLTLQGLEGKLFIPVALTIVFALSGLAAAVADA